MDDTVQLTDEQFDSFLARLGETVQPAVAAKAAEAVRRLDTTPAGAAPRVFGAAEADPAGDREARFFKAVLAGDRLAAKDLSAGAGAAGGYLVPAGFRAEVIRRLPDLAELAPHVRQVPVVTDTGSLPNLGTDISITWNAGATAEGGGFGATHPVLGQTTWSLKRADAISKLSRELVADSGPSVVEFVTGLFREAIARERDRVIAVGDGSDEPYGIYSSDGIGAVAVSGSLTFAALVEIEQTLKKKYRRGARWIMNGANLQRVYGLTDSQDRPIFVRDVMAGLPESRILGYPVAQQDDLPDHTVLFGDLGQYLWFDRGEMGIESTNDGGDAFANHQTWIKVWERVDGKVGLNEAFVRGTGVTG